MMIQKGVTRIVHGQNNTHVVDKADMKIQAVMLRHHPEVIIEEISNSGAKNTLLEAIDYMEVNHRVSPNY